MSKLLNIRRSTYGEYERGKIVPPIDKLKILADYFNVTVDYLTGNQKESILTSIEIILERLKNEPDDSLSLQQREVLIANIENGLRMLHILHNLEQS